MSDYALLRHTMRADEDVEIPDRVVARLVDAGLVLKRYCSDGDYISLTNKGKRYMGK